MHLPVLLQEAIELLNPQPGEFFIDGTFGGGGHAKIILEKIKPNGRLLAIDWNKEAIGKCEILQKQSANGELICIRENFANLPEILKGKANGLLLDLGVSSDELENSGRGFSFQKEEPLLMTYGDEQIPVKDWLKKLSEKELSQIIKDYSGERWAKKIAQAIKDYQRKKTIETSKELADIIFRAVPKSYERGRIHPATRAFMALRIFANQELKNLETVLQNMEKILLPGGRIAIISFHSLEDRIVKNYFKKFTQPINKKPITPTWEEVKNNPRSRSAKLRGGISKSSTSSNQIT